MLQPVTGGNRPDVDCAHKFIVETIFTPDGELTSLERLVTAAFPVELALGLTTFSSWGPACIGGGGTRRHHRCQRSSVTSIQSSSSRMRFMSHNWSATKQRLHVAEISRYSVLSGDRIRQCETSSGSRHKDTDQCL